MESELLLNYNTSAVPLGGLCGTSLVRYLGLDKSPQSPEFECQAETMT